MRNQFTQSLCLSLLISCLFILIVGCRKENITILEDKPHVLLPPEGYKLFWSDEFNKESLDMSKWNYRYLGNRREGFNSKEAVSIDTALGALVIETFHRNDTVFTGMIGTMDKFETKYGYFEISIKMEDIFPNYWSAFWMQSQKFGKTMVPEDDGMEIDVFEFIAGQPNRVDHYLHWNGYGVNHQQAYSITESRTPFNDGKFHQFALEWTPDYYRYFADGRMVWEYSNSVSQTDQYLILSTEVKDRKYFKEVLGDRKGTKFIVDYVRVYKK